MGEEGLQGAAASAETGLHRMLVEASWERDRLRAVGGAHAECGVVVPGICDQAASAGSFGSL